MNHLEATTTHTAERYLLGELPAGERDAFEEHYFGCTACAADVQDGATVIAGVRAAAREETPFQARRAARSRRNFTLPLAAAASLAIAYFGYEQHTALVAARNELAKAREPRAVSVYTLQDARAPQSLIVDAAVPFMLDFDIPPDPPSPQYSAAVVDGRGKTRYRLAAIPAADARHTIHLPVPGGILTPGNYTLQVHGAGGASVINYEFRVR